MRTLVLALLALVLVPSLAQAGGSGGTKQTGRVTVRNNGDEQLGVILDSTLPITATAEQFRNAGGRFVEPGQSVTFSNQKAGNHSVSAFFVNDTTGTPGAPATRQVTTRNGQTVNLSVSGNSSTGATISSTSSGGSGGSGGSGS